MATDGRDELFEALKAHASALEIARDAASGPERAALDRRLEDTRRLLEWAFTVVSTGAPASQAVEAPRPSTAGGPTSDRSADSSRQ